MKQEAGFIKRAKDGGRITSESEELGRGIARMTEPCVQKLASQDEPDERCVTCAFRAGTPPNRCADTLLDAVKCVVEHEPFYCHVNKGAICHGWFAVVATTKHAPGKAPFPFSHEEES